MASSLTLKKLVSSNLFPYSLRATRQAIPSTHSAYRFQRTFINPQPRYRNTLKELIALANRSALSQSKGRDVFDPFFPFGPASRGTGAGLRLGDKEDSLWDAEETDDNLYLRMDMPGLEKEDVKVIVEPSLIIQGETIVEQSTVIVKGETKEKSGEKNSGRRYTNKIDLPSKLYKTNQIKAEMKNGVLKIVVPKVKEEERPDVFHVKTE